MVKPMDKLSVVIVAKDEEENFKDLLPALNWADEIIVQVDDRTSDKSFDVATNLGAKVSREKFENFSQFKNLAIAKASCDWILLLDADERVSSKLEDEIRELLIANTSNLAYKFPWKNYIGKTWLRHGGLHPDYHIRLFKKGKARYSGEVHEQLKIDGEVGMLEGPVIHYTYKDLGELKEKVDYYSALEGKKVKSEDKSTLKAVAASLKRFIKVYVLQLGVLDGWVGLNHAYQLARYQWRMYNYQNK